MGLGGLFLVVLVVVFNSIVFSYFNSFVTLFEWDLYCLLWSG